jgi:hypothetical protein
MKDRLAGCLSIVNTEVVPSWMKSMVENRLQGQQRGLKINPFRRRQIKYVRHMSPGDDKSMARVNRKLIEERYKSVVRRQNIGIGAL